MTRIRTILRGIRSLRQTARRNQEIDEELLDFMERAAAHKISCGKSHPDAWREVRAEIGSRETVKHRVWSTGWESAAERWLRDAAYIGRRLWRTPGNVFVVILSIGLGIAANATIFSLVSKFVLAGAPVGDPKTLVTISRTFDRGSCCNALPLPVYHDVAEQTHSFSDVAAYYDLVPAAIGGGSEPERVWGQATTTNFFDVTQLRMACGRGFTHDEDKAPVVVLGYALWQRRFHGDPAIVNQPILLGGQVFTVAGVAPKEFRGVELLLNPEFWIPLGQLSSLAPNIPDPHSRVFQWIRTVARLRPGVTHAAAASELRVLGQRLANQYPDTDSGDGFQIDDAGSLPPRDKTSIEWFLAALSVVVLLVLLIACANVANLLLAQGARRQREMAVRLALGATRTHLLRQMLLESTVLALGGGLLGLLLSLWATYALSSFRLPAPVPMDLTVRVDLRVLLYTLGLSLAAGLVCGFAPAWQATRPALPGGLKGERGGGKPGRRSRFRNLLVVTQITLCFVLLSMAALFLRSLDSAASINIGFRSSGLLILAIDPPQHDYSAPRLRNLLRDVRERMLGVPGVLGVSTTDGIPLSMGHRSDGFAVEGKPMLADQSNVEMYMAGPEYLATLGIPRMAGRDFGSENPLAVPKVAVVNQEFVRRFFPTRNPLGQHIVDQEVVYEIVGVAGNTKSRSVGESSRPVMYRSIDQAIEKDPSPDGYQFLVRYRGDAAPLMKALRQSVQAEDPSLAVFNTQTMHEHLRDALFLPRLTGTLFTIFASIGLLLALIGLYSVVSYTVSGQTKEIGIRMALGAQSGSVQRLFVSQGMWLALLSVGIGLPIALATGRLARTLLYGVRPNDPAIFCAVPVLLLVVTLLACWLPSRRAASVDPVIALRVD